MPQGKVKWFSAKKVTDLSREEEKERDIFLHVSALKSQNEKIKRKSNFKV